MGLPRCLVASLLLVALDRGTSTASDFRLELTTGFTGGTERVSESARGITTRNVFEGSPSLGIALSHPAGRYLSGLAEIAIAPRHSHEFSSCGFNFTTSRCDFSPVERTNAQTYKYVIGVLVHPARRRVTPRLGVDIGGITYAFTAFDDRVDTRLLWSLRGGVTVELGRHALLLEGRRSTVSNPPFGRETFHPYEVRAGIELDL